MKYCKVVMGSILAVVLCLLSLYGISEDVKKSVSNCGDVREHDYSLAPRGLLSGSSRCFANSEFTRDFEDGQGNVSE